MVMLGQEKTNNLDCTNISRGKITSLLLMCLGWVVKSGWKEILVWGGEKSVLSRNLKTYIKHELLTEWKLHKCKISENIVFFFINLAASPKMV